MPFRSWLSCVRNLDNGEKTERWNMKTHMAIKDGDFGIDWLTNGREVKWFSASSKVTTSFMRGNLMT